MGSTAGSTISTRRFALRQHWLRGWVNALLRAVALRRCQTINYRIQVFCRRRRQSPIVREMKP